MPYVSVAVMVMQCAGLIDTKDVTEWENGFLKGLNERLDGDSTTTVLTSRQVEVLERIWKKHFA